MISYEDVVYSVGTQKSEFVTDGSIEVGIQGSPLSPLKLGLRKKTQLVCFRHDINTGAVMETHVLNPDWPKGKLSLADNNNLLFGLLETIDGLTLYEFNLNLGEQTR